MQKIFWLSLLWLHLLCEGGDFLTVHPQTAEFGIVEQSFQKVITPLYGDQTSSLAKIAKENDRTCELLYDDLKNPVGILVYKNFPTQEFASLGIRDALEIKTLFVFENNSGKGFGSQLINKVFKVAENSLFRSVVVTVSEEKPESVNFFKKHGFSVAHTFCEKYKKGIDEYLLVCFLK